MFYKIYKSGDNIEIYTYEKGGGNDLGFQNGYEKVLEDLNKEVILEEKDRKLERRQQTLRENKMNLKRMAREYFKGNVFFVTLTFEENQCDIDSSDRKLKYFLKKLRGKYGDVSYMAIREKQKRGALHYHLLLKNDSLEKYYLSNIPKPQKRGRKFITSEEQKEMERFIQKEFWIYGFVNFTMIDFVDDSGAYLTKYMTKNHIKEMEWLEKRKLILKSTDIKKIEPLDTTSDSVLIKEILSNLDVYKSIAKEDIKNKLKRKRVFTNGYENEFVGQVLYYDIHKNRL